MQRHLGNTSHLPGIAMTVQTFRKCVVEETLNHPGRVCQCLWVLRHPFTDHARRGSGLVRRGSGLDPSTEQLSLRKSLNLSETQFPDQYLAPVMYVELLVPR